MMADIVHGREHYVKAVLTALADGKPKSARDIINATGIDEKTISHLLSNLWRKQLILRTDKPLFEYSKQFKGRAGFKSNTRMFHLYIINDQTGQGGEERADKETTPIVIDDHRFVQFSSEYSDKRGNRGSKSKAQLVLNFLKQHSDKAFYSTEIFNALKEKGVTMPDIMTTARRYERKGLLYVRGYQTHDSQSPFQEGYLITWIEHDEDRQQDDLAALKQAVLRTNEALKDNASTNPLVQRVLAIRNLIVSETQLDRITSVNQIKDMLKAATDTEAESAITRAMQLYPSIKEIKLFDAYRYYYHESMNAEVLNGSLEMAKNYIRISKGRANRVGHNWEACVEWFIDKFTIGAEFRTQNHRQNGKGNVRMDPRRITLHLIKSVGDRRQSAEVDRVWTVTPSVFAKPVTYVLECKWGIVSRRDLDDFFNVLKWSTDFGVDTPEGRRVKNGVVGVFAGGAFEDIHVKVANGGSSGNNGAITLAQYAERLNVQLLRASDFNEKLRDREAPKDVTVQKICKAARDERDVRRMLDLIWDKPEDAKNALNNAIKANDSVFKFEEELEATNDNKEEGKGKEKEETAPTIESPSTAAAEV
ncbi:MAG: hypothetical protein HRF40_05250 [Nitrososphaera sp.]|jgi:hypothetical protein